MPIEKTTTDNLVYFNILPSGRKRGRPKGKSMNQIIPAHSKVGGQPGKLEGLRLDGYAAAKSLVNDMLRSCQ